MKFWKLTLLTALIFSGVSAMLLYSSCEKDNCASLTCQNGGSCGSGTCHCPTGFEGTECETYTNYRYLGTYIGYHACNNGSAPGPEIEDTVVIFPTASLTVVGIVEFFPAGSPNVDTFYATITSTESSYALAIPTVTDTTIHYTLARSASLQVDKNLEIHYTSQLDTAHETCLFMGTKI